MKPKVIVHMMSSVDGRLHVDRYSEQYNGKSIEQVMDHYWTAAAGLGGDAVMMGRTTLQESYFPDMFDYEKYTPAAKHTTHVARPAGGTPDIVIDTKGKTLYEGHDEQHFITILGEGVSDEYLTHLREKKVSYLFAGADGKDLNKALEILGTEFGLKTIVLEGGAHITGSFLKAGLIDELSLMVYPSIVGLSGEPAIFEYKGGPDERPADGQMLELTSAEKAEDGIVWMHYKFHKSK